MSLNALDFAVIAGCLTIAFLPALVLARRASRGTVEFFASGRSAPWWLIGTSMVATTFSTDTPNLVTQFVREEGVCRNWQWWSFLLSGMLTVFFFARLWRRSGVMTDLELYELRYSGRPAVFLRAFRAVYLGLAVNCIIMATVTLAAAKIANVMLGWDRMRTAIVCTLICIPISATSGLWGVLASDLVQFVIAMVGVIAAAIFLLHLPQVGGMSGLIEQLPTDTLRLLPDLLDTEMMLAFLAAPLLVQWWSVWYPGAEPGGGSYVAQRMLAARNEKHAMGATLWYNVAHYALRPWPWIIVALCSMVVFPTRADLRRALPHLDAELIGHDMAYPAMLTLLPHGLLGLLVASLAAAYVSTMSTHLNWGASYLVHDLYRRFLRPAADERHYVLVSRCVTAGLMIASAALMFGLKTAGAGFQLLIDIGAGTGLVYLLRWYWWRVNAWSELAAMIGSAGVSLYFYNAQRVGAQLPPYLTLAATVGLTSLVWLAATFLTRPVNAETLKRFYDRVRPAGPGWNYVRSAAGLAKSPDRLAMSFVGWVSGCAMVYAALFSVGSFLYGRTDQGLVFVGVFAAGALIVWRTIVVMWRTE
ncbi:MAG: Na+:solute symporter [Phycisphaerae bacterium]|nr:Na+:solute symporter [Phycisphaerae bacterium]NUQ46799.1 Na+:solute symporter [Phycisphaerae bacterium]